MQSNCRKEKVTSEKKKKKKKKKRMEKEEELYNATVEMYSYSLTSQQCCM
jgi:hypothetical protein